MEGTSKRAAIAVLDRTENKGNPNSGDSTEGQDESAREGPGAQERTVLRKQR